VKEAPVRWIERWLGPRAVNCKVAKENAGGLNLECPSNTHHEHVMMISAFNAYITIYR